MRQRRAWLLQPSELWLLCVPMQEAPVGLYVPAVQAEGNKNDARNHSGARACCVRPRFFHIACGAKWRRAAFQRATDRCR